MPWKVQVTSETTTPSGKRRRFSRTIDSPSCVKAWIEANLPSAFHGCAVRVVTPIHNNIGVVDPDTRTFKLDA